MNRMKEKAWTTTEALCRIAARLGIRSDRIKRIEPFTSKEDGEPYAVWRVDTDAERFVLKRADAAERAVYGTFLSSNPPYAPRLFAAAAEEGAEWLLLEYCAGEDLCRCDRKRLSTVIDALAAMQTAFWERSDLVSACGGVPHAIEGRRRRGTYLFDPVLETAYARYLDAFERLPRTLCHDDLLPFNVLSDGTRAVLIDWEHAGMLPYPTSLARLLAHGQEQSDALFYCTEADRAFAIEACYERSIRQKGIGYAAYREALDLCLFYEYCEWIMLGNRYEQAKGETYERSQQEARRLAVQINGNG